MPFTLNRRWFRFGLRGLFVAIAVAAAPLAWIVYHQSWSADRQHALQALVGRDASIVYAGDGFLIQRADGVWREPDSLNLPAASFGLRILGEKTVHFIFLPAELEAKLPELRRLFPESDVQVKLGERNHSKANPPQALPPTRPLLPASRK